MINSTDVLEQEADIIPIGRNKPLEFAISYIIRNRSKTVITIRSQHYIWLMFYALAQPMREHDRELSDKLLHIADELKTNDSLLNGSGRTVRALFRHRRIYQIWDTESLIRFMETLAMCVRAEDTELSNAVLQTRDRIEDNYDHNTSGALVIAEYFCE